jgi:hypothetical protein
MVAAGAFDRVYVVWLDSASHHTKIHTPTHPPLKIYLINELKTKGAYVVGALREGWLDSTSQHGTQLHYLIPSH